MMIMVLEIVTLAPSCVAVVLCFFFFFSMVNVVVTVAVMVVEEEHHTGVLDGSCLGSVRSSCGTVQDPYIRILVLLGRSSAGDVLGRHFGTKNQEYRFIYVFLCLRKR